jgi:hypothetical protein
MVYILGFWSILPKLFFKTWNCKLKRKRVDEHKFTKNKRITDHTPEVGLIIENTIIVSGVSGVQIKLEPRLLVHLAH